MYLRLPVPVGLCYLMLGDESAHISTHIHILRVQPRVLLRVQVCSSARAGRPVLFDAT